MKNASITCAAVTPDLSDHIRLRRRAGRVDDVDVVDRERGGEAPNAAKPPASARAAAESPRV